jgi:hypothetical protein
MISIFFFTRTITNISYLPNALGILCECFTCRIEIENIIVMGIRSMCKLGTKCKTKIPKIAPLKSLFGAKAH